MAYHHDIPDTLNGYPVIAVARTGMRDRVIVRRVGHPVHEYVAATWDGQEAWHNGHYCTTLEGAKEVFGSTIIWHDRDVSEGAA